MFYLSLLTICTCPCPNFVSFVPMFSFHCLYMLLDCKFYVYACPWLRLRSTYICQACVFGLTLLFLQTPILNFYIFPMFCLYFYTFYHCCFYDYVLSLMCLSVSVFVNFMSMLYHRCVYPCSIIVNFMSILYNCCVCLCSIIGVSVYVSVCFCLC